MVSSQTLSVSQHQSLSVLAYMPILKVIGAVGYVSYLCMYIFSCLWENRKVPCVVWDRGSLTSSLVPRPHPFTSKRVW